MKTRMSFEAMHMPTDDHNESDMRAWANKWHFTGDETENVPLDSASHVEMSEEPATSGVPTDSDSEDH
jgi:hypothetical protein